MIVVIDIKVCLPGEANQWVNLRSYDPIITNDDDDDDVQDVIKMATGGVQSYYTTTL